MWTFSAEYLQKYKKFFSSQNYDLLGTCIIHAINRNKLAVLLPVPVYKVNYIKHVAIEST